jgi:hypothetical protein
MKKAIVAIMFGLVFAGARSASATTYNSYVIQGNSCVSITNGVSAVANTWGITAFSTPLNVTCPVIVPDHVYNYANIVVTGYNRSDADNVNCTIAGTGAAGTNPESVNAALPDNSPYSQVKAAHIFLANSYLFVNCHIPAQTGSGLSHLSSVYLTLGY